MSLFSSPAEHAANPPSTWRVVKHGNKWALRTASGDTIGYYETKKAAEEDKRSGPYVRLYNDETRWYAGEPVPGWKPYGSPRRRSGMLRTKSRAARRRSVR